jgi:hypothetical protein
VNLAPVAVLRLCYGDCTLRYLLVVAYGANSVEVTPTLISVDLFVRDMSLVLAPLPDFILHNVSPLLYIFQVAGHTPVEFVGWKLARLVAISPAMNCALGEVVLPPVCFANACANRIGRN